MCYHIKVTVNHWIKYTWYNLYTYYYNTHCAAFFTSNFEPELLDNGEISDCMLYEVVNEYKKNIQIAASV